jgi:uncharacterized protein
MMRMRAEMLGQRLHLQDGPIDLIIAADGEPRHTLAAYSAATRRFASVLDELCGELGDLRRANGSEPQGAIARRMWRAVRPFADERFVTPMAAVAGAVAEVILKAMVEAAPLQRAYVNNGGDIAFHLGANRAIRIGLVDRPERPSLFGAAVITADDAVRGAATSGRSGRSFSLGIADAVTALAESAAEADAAATIIANDVDLPRHAAIRRLSASQMQPDSDLGDIPVTVAVGRLRENECAEALARGAATARELIARGLIFAAALHLQGRTRCEGGNDCLERAANG